MLAEHRYDFADFRRLRTAICITQNHPLRTCINGRFCAFQRIFRIGFIAVEKVLAINECFLARCNRSLN